LDSILGYFGKQVRQTCEKLIKHNLVHLVASDSHFPKQFSLQQSLKTVSHWVGEEKALKLFTENPQRIVKGEDLRTYEPEKIKKSRSFLILVGLRKKADLSSWQNSKVISI